MKNMTLIMLFYTTLLLHGCEGKENTNMQQNQQKSEEQKFRTITPERYLLENHKTLKDEDIVKYLKALNKNEKLTLQIYEAWGSYLLYRACKADSSMSIELMQGVQNCQENYNRWLNTAYVQTIGTSANYFDINDWYQNAPRPLLTDEVFSYAYEQAEQQLIAIKCDTGEIDKGSCKTYFNGIAQAQNSINSINDARIRSYEETTQQLYGCTYEGQILEDGSVCIR